MGVLAKSSRLILLIQTRRVGVANRSPRRRRYWNDLSSRNGRAVIWVVYPSSSRAPGLLRLDGCVQLVMKLVRRTAVPRTGCRGHCGLSLVVAESGLSGLVGACGVPLRSGLRRDRGHTSSPTAALTFARARILNPEFLELRLSWTEVGGWKAAFIGG